MFTYPKGILRSLGLVTCIYAQEWSPLALVTALTEGPSEKAHAAFSYMSGSAGSVDVFANGLASVQLARDVRSPNRVGLVRLTLGNHVYGTLLLHNGKAWTKLEQYSTPVISPSEANAMIEMVETTGGTILVLSRSIEKGITSFVMWLTITVVDSNSGKAVRVARLREREESMSGDRIQRRALWIGSLEDTCGDCFAIVESISRSKPHGGSPEPIVLRGSTITNCEVRRIASSPSAFGRDESATSDYCAAIGSPTVRK